MVHSHVLDRANAHVRLGAMRRHAHRRKPPAHDAVVRHDEAQICRLADDGAIYRHLPANEIHDASELIFLVDRRQQHHVHVQLAAPLGQTLHRDHHRRERAFVVAGAASVHAAVTNFWPQCALTHARHGDGIHVRLEQQRPGRASNLEGSHDVVVTTARSYIWQGYKFNGVRRRWHLRRWVRSTRANLPCAVHGTIDIA
jgi:hypothetical protein